MTIPLLTQILTEPSKRSDVPAKPRNPSSTYDRTDRRDDRDFASVMSDRKRDNRKDVHQADKPQQARDRDRAPEARQTDKIQPDTRQASDTTTRAAPDGPQAAAEITSDQSGDETAPELAQGETPRRQVAIPELPVRRAAVVESVQGRGAADVTVPMTGQTPQTPAPDVPAATEGDMIASPEAMPLIAPSRTAETGAPEFPAKAAAPGRPDSMPGIAKSEVATSPSAAVALPTEEADAQKTLELPADPARDIPRRHTDLTPAETRTPAQALPGAQIAHSVQLRKTAQASMEAAADDRAVRHAREPASRAVEAVAAAAANAPTPQATAALTSASAQLAAMQPAAKDVLAAKEKADTAFSLEGETESLRLDLRGTSGPGSTQQGSFVPAMARSDMARHVAMQIAEFARNMPDRPIDVSLSPEELGRVRLSISTSEGGVTLHVLAERPETLDLMRRHADQLARELADLGFSSIDLAFGHGRDRDGEANDGNGSAARGGTGTANDESGTVSSEDRPVNRLTLNESGGLDIRI